MAAEELQIGSDGNLQTSLEELQYKPGSTKDEQKNNVKAIRNGLTRLVTLSKKYKTDMKKIPERKLKDNMEKIITDLNKRLVQNPELLKAAGKELTGFYLFSKPLALRRLVSDLIDDLEDRFAIIADREPEYFEPFMDNLQAQEEQLDESDRQRRMEERAGLTTEEYTERNRRNAEQLDAVEREQQQLTEENMFRTARDDPSFYPDIDMSYFADRALERQREQRGSGMTSPLLTSHYHLAKHGQLY